VTTEADPLNTANGHAQVAENIFPRAAKIEFQLDLFKA
jgi:hypothetical protein